MQDTPIQRQKFYSAIKDAYSGDVEMTARECAVCLLHTGLTKYGIRQEVQPRLNELCKLGILETVGSKFDEFTKKTVTIYKEKKHEN